MLQVVKIEDITLLLSRLQSPAKLQGQAGVNSRRAVIGGNILLYLRGLLAKIVFRKFFQRLFDSVPACVEFFPDIRVQIFQIAVDFAAHGCPGKLPDLTGQFVPFGCVRLMFQYIKGLADSVQTG